MSSWFDLLRGLFGRRDQPGERKDQTEIPSPTRPLSTRGDAPEPKLDSIPPRPTKAQPKRSDQKPAGPGAGRSLEYLIVVGLDFGTAYTKCVMRDALVRDPGKAFPVPFELADGWTYLVPSVVIRKPDGLASAFDGPLTDASERIDYLKMRLVAELDRQRAGAWRDGVSSAEAQVLVAWFLAQVLARVGRAIRLRWTDFGSCRSDQCFINICVPIAHADGSAVEKCLLDALCAARNALGPAGTATISVDQIRTVLADTAMLNQARQHCYAYPETSANLQSYLKSRARQPGLYLFSDVGAGTVDLTFFQLMADPGDDTPLRYYHASVLDAGSSKLELKAKELDPSLSLLDLIAAKEGHPDRQNDRLARALAAARIVVHDEIASGVGRGVTVTESKLHRDRFYQRSQMRNIRLMYSGGGYTNQPYGEAVRAFYRLRQWDHLPELKALPIPDDMVWSPNIAPISFCRLSVAYGLAFARYELDGHRFPSQTAVNPDSPLRKSTERPSAPTKDEV